MSKKRQQLIDTAIELFNEHGFHGVGIDRIAEVSGVTKKTLYHHFRSKEELILAALKQKDSTFRNDFMRAVEATGNTPHQRLLGIFDVAQAWFSDQKFYGCMFINAVGEYSEPDTAIRAACKSFKQQILSYIQELAEQADVDDPRRVAVALAILLEGATVTAQVSQNPEAAQAARQTAEILLNAATRKAA